MGLVAYVVSYLISYFFCEKLGIEKLISHKTSILISLFLIVVLVGIIGNSIIDSFNTTERYGFLYKALLSGPMTALIVFIVPVNNKKTKL